MTIRPPLFCALLCALAPAARAQTVPALPPDAKPAAPPPAPISPPKLVESTAAEYPPSEVAQGRGARVVLELDLDDKGAVAAARVTSPPQPGFDESALAAARKLRFEPARQAESPIGVRIQFAFTFAPPPPPRAPQAAEVAAEKPVNLSGAVRERGSRKKLAGVEVSVPAASLSSITDKEGRFELRGVPAGDNEVVLTAPGYERLAVQETVAEGQRAEVLYRLQPLYGNPLEAVVEGERQRKELSRTSLATAEIERIPGSQGDALKVIEDLPGVARTSPIGGGLLVIRGSKPGDSLVFLDGQQIPLLYHFGALSSTINSDLLEGIDLLPGNFSALYGDMTGGLVEVRSRKPKEELHGYANISLIDTSLLLEGPVPGVEGLTFAAAGRRSYFDLLLKAAFSGASTDIGLSVAPVYYDAQFRLEYQPKGSPHRLSLFALTSKDELGLLFKRPLDSDPNVSGDFELVTAFSQIRLRDQYRSGPWSVDTTAMFEWIDLKVNIGTQFFTLQGPDLFLRSTVTRDVDESLTLAGGVDLANRHPRVTSRFSAALYVREGQFNQNTPPRPDDALLEIQGHFNRFSPGLWGEARYRPITPLSITAGLRLDLYKYSTNPDPHFTLSPRLAARYQLTEQVVLKGGAGLYTEGARNGDAALPFGSPLILPERAWQTTAGAEVRPAPGLFLSGEAYYKWLGNVISSTSPSNDALPSLIDNSGIGHVYGIELLLRKELSERFFGWLAYSLSRSVRLDRPGAGWRLFDFDQTHAVTLIGSYKLGRGWQAGARFRLISGNPETPVLGSRYLASADVYLPIFGPSNSSRLPVFHQLDLRVDKVWTFDSWSLDLYLDVINAYSHRSTEATNYSYDYSQQSAFKGLPILPSIGAKGSF